MRTMTQATSSLHAGLNPEQLQVVEHQDGPLLVGAIAGAGKTRALVTRSARLVEKGARPERILALTFSKDAADEMNDRLNLLLPGSGARIGTFHSFCLEVLRTEGRVFEVDGKDRYRVIAKQVLGYTAMNWTQADVTLVLEFIGRCKANGDIAGSTQAMQRAQNYYNRKPGPSTTPRLLCEAYERIEMERKSRGLLTFDDMLLDVATLFTTDENARLRWANRYDYVEQDEGQDCSPVQNVIATAMARDHRNYMVVGDCSQAIYGFRGADVTSMTRFPAEWPGSVSIMMCRNYRSGRDIAKAANGVLRCMKVRLEGLEIVAERDLDGLVTTTSYEDQDDEARSITADMQALHEDDVRWGDMAVLYRTNAQSRAMEEALLGARVPHKVLGGTAFYARKEVADVLSYLRAAIPTSRWEHVKRSINAPFRYLASAFLKRCEEEAAQEPSDVEMDWPALVRSVSRQGGVQQRQQASAEEWASLIDWIKREMSRASSSSETRALPAAILDRVVMATKFIDYLTKDEGEETVENSRASNVRELIRAAEKFTTVEEFLQHVDETIQRSNQERNRKDGNRVLLMSVHKCVHPSTLVETDGGMMEMEDAISSSAGMIATVDGAREFCSPVSFEERDLLTIKTTSGYEVTVTDDHGMMVWSDGQYVRREANALTNGDLLRLRVGVVMEPTEKWPALPPPPPSDVRAFQYLVPGKTTPEVAEFFGLMVADGTVFNRGFRLLKRHNDVRDRFADLVDLHFSRMDQTNRAPVAKRTGEAPNFAAEVSSTFLSDWLLSVGGMGPNDKYVPPCVLRGGSAVHIGFLRGLFEDATVNLDGNGVADHIAFHTAYERMSVVVQTMLLRLGIISSRFSPIDGQWRVDIYGDDMIKFRDAIGFISSFKNERLAGLLPATRGNRLIPIDREWVKKNVQRRDHDRANAIARGYVTRRVAAKWGMQDDLRFHHERIASVEMSRGPAMCVEVPNHGRFIQNGFDGCNSKGLEFQHVWVISCNDRILPHARAVLEPDGLEEERRLAYVAFTRAKDALRISWVRTAVVGPKLVKLGPSCFIDEAGLPHETVPKFHAGPVQAPLFGRAS